MEGVGIATMQLALVLISLLGAALTSAALLILRSNAANQARDAAQAESYRKDIRERVNEIAAMVQLTVTDIAVLKAQGNMALILKEGLDRMAMAVERREEAIAQLMEELRRQNNG